MPETILITGANRGLGLEFVRQYAKAHYVVHACCRVPAQAKELKALQQDYPDIQIHALDVTSSEAIAALQKNLTQPIDILLNNAGVLKNRSAFGELSLEDLQEAFLTNAVAPLKMAEAFTPQLAKSHKKLVVCVSSRMGSIHDNTSGGSYSYRASKAALNMLMRSAAYDLKPYGISVLLLHPGWVKTDMGGKHAMLEPEESVRDLRKVIENAPAVLGEVAFYNGHGESIPW